MISPAKAIKLRSSELAEFQIVLAPDESEFAHKLRPLLAHKRRWWTWQINQCLTCEFRSQSRFYVLSSGGQPFSTIMTCELSGVGIFGHVYTRPEFRRKGAADLLTQLVLEDFQKRGGKALFLGTDFGTHPYYLYQKNGFASVAPESGYMAFFSDSAKPLDFEADMFSPAAAEHADLTFDYWPALPALSLMRHPAHVRISGMRVNGQVSTEAGALPYLMAMAGEPDQPEDTGARARLAISEKSAIPVAVAAARPDWNFGGSVDLVDLFCAPGFERELPGLLEELKLDPARRQICYADPFWPERKAALRECGFKKCAELKRFIFLSRAHHDAELWSSG